MEWKDSKTQENLMRAFAGESQARNRYTFAAAAAAKQNLHVVEAVFLFTADQERAHGKVYYDLLKQQNWGGGDLGEGAFPVDLTEDPMELLDMAARHERQECEEIYPAFARTAKEEGFPEIAAKFMQIADVEKLHHQRFENLYTLMRQGKLFLSDSETGWVCMNCGHVVYSREAPRKCPVCGYDQGYFIRLELSFCQ